MLEVSNRLKTLDTLERGVVAQDTGESSEGATNNHHWWENRQEVKRSEENNKTEHMIMKGRGTQTRPKVY